MASGSGAPIQTILDLFRGDVGYATPKVDVRGAAFVDGRILDGARDQRWPLDSSGRMGGCEPVGRRMRHPGNSRGIRVRSCRAEARGGVGLPQAGARLAPPRLDLQAVLHLPDRRWGAASSAETSEVSFFARDSLPPLSPGRVTPAQIARMFEHAERPELAADFD